MKSKDGTTGGLSPLSSSQAITSMITSLQSSYIILGPGSSDFTRDLEERNEFDNNKPLKKDVLNNPTISFIYMGDQGLNNITTTLPMAGSLGSRTDSESVSHSLNGSRDYDGKSTLSTASKKRQKSRSATQSGGADSGKLSDQWRREYVDNEEYDVRNGQVE